MHFQDLKTKFHDLIVALQGAGGNLVFVGGCVRDILRGTRPKDFDAEAYGLSAGDLEATLKTLGPVKTVGKTFGVFYLQQHQLEIALPRTETKTHKGHKGFAVNFDPSLSFKEAARRRDLTINSMGYDPLTNTLLDPWQGQRDLAQGVLRATNPQSFGEDPLRSLRVMQFAARFEMTPDADLIALCGQQDLSELPSERLLEEFRKLLLKGEKPSLGLRFLEQSTLLRFFPELVITKDLCDTLDRVAQRRGERRHHRNFPFMLMLLCLSMKEAHVRAFLQKIKVSKKIEKETLLFNHLYALLQSDPTPYTYRRVAYEIYDHGYDISKFLWLAQLGMHDKTVGDQMRSAQGFVRKRVLPIVKGKHLMRWTKLDPQGFSKILAQCHDLQLKENLLSAKGIWQRWLSCHEEK